MPSGNLLNRCGAFIAVCSGALSKRITIRSTDALHLVCAKAHGLRRVYTNDRHMLLAAAAFGVEVMAIAAE